MIHSISSADNASSPCLSPRPIAAKKSFTVWTFSSMLIKSLRFRYIGSCDVCDHDSSVELDQVLKDQLTPAISARLHKQSTFRKPAKFDRRETETFRKRTNLRCCAVIVARQEHDSPATMYGRILVKDGSDQMVEALNQSSTSEGLRDDLGRRLSPQFLRGHAVGIGHIDDGLSLPGRQRLRDILVRLETDSQKDDVRLDRFRQLFGNDRGSDRGCGGCKAFRVARGCNGYFDAVAGKRLGQGLADIAEADNCVAHIFSLGLPRPTALRIIEWSAWPGAARQSCARPPSTATSLAVMKLLSDDARKAATAPISAGSAMRLSGLSEAKNFMPSSPSAAFARSVAVPPGDSTFTRMPVPFRSSAQVRARLRTAALLAL